MSMFKQEALMAQRILKKEYKLNSYDSTPLSIPFQGSNFQLLGIKGNTGSNVVRVTFDELDPIDMVPGETITGFLFREVKLAAFEDGPTHATVFMSKENDGRTPKLEIDEEIKTKSKKVVQRISHLFVPPLGWLNTYGPKGTLSIATQLLSPDDILPGEEFVSCEFYFDFCTLLDDITVLQTVSSVNVLASGSTYNENFDLTAALTDVFTDLDALTYNDYSELDGGSMGSNRTRQCGLIFHFGALSVDDIAADLKGVLVPFPDTLKLNSDYLCKCEGGYFKVDNAALLNCYLPSTLDSIFAAKDGISFGMADDGKRLGVKITKVLTVLQ